MITRSFFLRLLTAMILASLVLLPVLSSPVSASTGTSTQNAGTSLELTLHEVGMTSPQILSGPYSEYTLPFSFPNDWRLTGQVKLNASIYAYFSSLVSSESGEALSGLVGGELTVLVNGKTIATRTLSQSGEQAIAVEFDATLLKSPGSDPVNELTFQWDGSTSCSMNLLSSITLMPNSTLGFEYSQVEVDASLSDFPAPFIMLNSIQTRPLTLVVPSSPTANELRAALIVAAGIGKLSSGEQEFRLVSLDEFDAASLETQSVILVLSTDTLSNVDAKQLGLTADLQVNPGEGLLHAFKTPTGTYGLLVSGDNAGIVSAAQTFSAGQVFGSTDPATMTISAVNPAVVDTRQDDMTLTDLGAGELVFSASNPPQQTVEFYIPQGDQATADSTFDLVISHSQQLDYLNSGLNISLNGAPLTSIRLNDSTANQALFRLILPANLIRAGRNTITFSAALNLRDLCSKPGADILWLRVSSESLLHIPVEKASGGSFSAAKFSDFPDAFLTGSGMDNVTFALQAADMSNFETALKLAYFLGSNTSQTPPLQLQATFADQIDLSVLPPTSLILIGNPADFPSLSAEEGFPSLIFNAEGGLAADSKLTFVPAISADMDTGYLVIRGYSAESDRYLMAVLGNNPTGLGYALDAIMSKQISETNFAISTDDSTVTGWMDQGIATGEVSAVTSGPTEAPVSTNTPAMFKYGILKWILPVLIASLALLVVMLYIEVKHWGKKS